MVGAFPRGFLAALRVPSGVDEGVIPNVAPPVDVARGPGGRLGSESVGETLAVGLEGVGGDEGEGVSKGPSPSASASGLVGGEAMMLAKGGGEVRAGQGERGPKESGGWSR